MKATLYLGFFEKMKKKEIYQEKKIHQKCCEKMSYKLMEKGATAIEISKKKII